MCAVTLIGGSAVADSQSQGSTVFPKTRTIRTLSADCPLRLVSASLHTSLNSLHGAATGNLSVVTLEVSNVSSHTLKSFEMSVSLPGPKGFVPADGAPIQASLSDQWSGRMVPNGKQQLKVAGMTSSGTHGPIQEVSFTDITLEDGLTWTSQSHGDGCVFRYLRQ